LAIALVEVIGSTASDFDLNTQWETQEIRLVRRLDDVRWKVDIFG
jgi:hypothetical protein